MLTTEPIRFNVVNAVRKMDRWFLPVDRIGFAQGVLQRCNRGVVVCGFVVDVRGEALGKVPRPVAVINGDRSTYRGFAPIKGAAVDPRPPLWFFRT